MKTIISFVVVMVVLSSFTVLLADAPPESVPPAENLQTVRVEVEHCNSGVVPFCFEYVVQKGDTVWLIGKFLHAPGERTIDVKNRIVAIKQNQAQFEKVSPRLKKISSEPGHWIFPGQKIVIPVVSLAAKQSAEAAAKKSLEKAAAKVREAMIEKFWRDILTAAIIVAFLVLICAVIMLYYREKQSLVPRTATEREEAINDPQWRINQSIDRGIKRFEGLRNDATIKENDPEDPDKKTKPSGRLDWDE